MAHFEETAVGFKAIFQKIFNETEAKADVLATKVPSNDLSEKYTWLGNFPDMKEWIGERDVKVFSDFGYALENKLYEATVTVPNTHIEYDKVGLYPPAIAQMAVNAKKFGAKLVASVLTSGHTGLCYDGKPFFATNHMVGEGEAAVAVSNTSAGVLNSDNILAGMEAMETLKNENGNTLGIVPTLLVCGPKNRANAIRALKKEFTAGGESNETFEVMEYLVLSEITDMSWYLLDVSRPLKPFVLQVAKDGLYEASNDDKFIKDHALFGVKSFMNAGYGLWQLARKYSGIAPA